MKPENMKRKGEENENGNESARTTELLIHSHYYTIKDPSAQKTLERKIRKKFDRPEVGCTNHSSAQEQRKPLLVT